jgi:hypothetical protein
MSSSIFDLVPFIIGIAFVFIIGSILFKAFSGVVEWSNNNSMPILTVRALLVAKRVDTKIHRHHNHNNGSFNNSRTSSTNSYYLTFETLESRERMVFKVKRREYDLLIEHDTGGLTYQGTRYHGFSR